MINQNEDRRLASLDVFRGITVAGMILVNNEPGETFTPLAHSEWNGMTPCDLVFPFFLYIMGISTFLSHCWQRIPSYSCSATAMPQTNRTSPCA